MKLLDTVPVVALLLAGVIVGGWQTDIGDWGDSLNEVDTRMVFPKCTFGNFI